jgi:hypothetical protein
MAQTVDELSRRSEFKRLDISGCDAKILDADNGKDLSIT